MKKTLLLLVALITATIAFAQTEINGIYYNLNDETKTAEVTSNSNGYSGDIIILEKVTYNTTEYNVTSIGRYAFYGCSSLTSITIPNSVTSIGVGAFNNCSSLASITIPNSVTSIGSSAFHKTPWLNNQPDGCLYIGKCLYQYKGEMPEHTHIDVNEGTTTICDYAFSGCSSLTSITIPNSVTSIGYNAFYDCSSLTSITIPNSVTSIGSGAFFDCSSLDTLICSSSNNLGFNDNSLFQIPTLRYLTAPAVAFNTFTEKKQTEFSNKLTEVHISDGELNENGFNFINRSKKTLHTIDLAGATNTAINDLAFYDCYKLENLTLPKNIETIGYKAFAECVHIKQLEIPATVTNIEERAFENCCSINTLTFEEGSQLETISSWAFYNNHALESIELPEGVTEIGDAAFYGCNYVEEIVIPASVQRIGDNGFALCNQVKRMEVRATTPPAIEAKTFHQVSRNIEFIVPAEARDAYAEDEYWREFIQEAPTNVENTIECIEIYTTNGILHIEGATDDYHILDAAGRLIYSGNATTLQLPRGIYLVTMGGEVEKIVL
ncbi:MAG: leucine-rich repeat domain-containing protein [Paludibacteraceae bacterium]|nr:leucine-rich repeat domain-containing protein [Paludibacteraceae bacterium]